MKAFVLAAGFGTRLLPLTKNTPKPLVKVQGVPLIVYTLAELKHVGITEVIINLHHLGEQIEAFLRDGKEIGMKIEYSHEDPILGTGGGIAKILPQLSQDFLVINADIITDFDFARLAQTHRLNRPLATLMLRPFDSQRNFGRVTCRDGKVTSILEKQGFDGDIQTHFTGVHMISQEQLQNFLKHRSLQPYFCIVNDVYRPYLTSQAASLSAFVHNGLWEDCGTFEAIQEIEKRDLNLSYQKELNDMLDVLNHSKA